MINSVMLVRYTSQKVWFLKKRTISQILKEVREAIRYNDRMDNQPDNISTFIKSRQATDTSWNKRWKSS